MKFITTSVAFALLTVLAQAAPNKARTVVAPIRFEGADPDAFFEQGFVVDGSDIAIDNPLSVSWIQGLGGQATCTFDGADGSVTTVTGTDRVAVGPPQTQISGSCVW